MTITWMPDSLQELEGSEQNSSGKGWSGDNRIRKEQRHWTQTEMPLKIWKYFCCESDQALHRLPREVVDSLSLEIFKNCLDTVLDSWLWATLLEQGLGEGDFQGCILSSASLAGGQGRSREGKLLLRVLSPAAPMNTGDQYTFHVSQAPDTA